MVLQDQFKSYAVYAVSLTHSLNKTKIFVDASDSILWGETLSGESDEVF